MTWDLTSAGVRRGLAALLVAAASAMAAGDAAAQARVVGRVTDALGRPLAGVQVVLVREVGDSLVRTTVEAGETGGFQFDGLAPGTYRIRASDGGVASGEREVTVEDGGRRLVILRLTTPEPRLRRNAEARPSP
jgi:hypothetical protein